MSSSCCINVTQAPKVERWGCGVRELGANPQKPASIPCLLRLSLQKQQARILTPSKKVTKSIKSSVTWLINTVKTAGTSLYPEASRGRRNSHPTNAMRNEYPTWPICSFGKGGLTSYAGAEWLRTRSSRHLRGMQQVRTVVWSPPQKSRTPHHKTVQLPRMLHQLHILVLGYGLRGPVLDQTFSSPRISAVQLSLALLTTNTIADLRN